MYFMYIHTVAPIYTGGPGEALQGPRRANCRLFRSEQGFPDPSREDSIMLKNGLNIPLFLQIVSFWFRVLVNIFVKNVLHVAKCVITTFTKTLHNKANTIFSCICAIYDIISGRSNLKIHVSGPQKLFSTMFQKPLICSNNQ